MLTTILLLFPSSLVFSQPNITNNQSLSETYDRKGIKISYPYQWELVEPSEEGSDNLTNVANFKSSVNNNSINIVIEKLQNGVAIDEYVTTGINYLNSSTIKIYNVESRDSTLAGNPAKTIVFTMTNGSTIYRVMEIVSIKENNAYVITYLGSKDQYPLDFQTANNMINSFRIGSSYSWEPIILVIIFVIFFAGIIAFMAYVFKKFAQNLWSLFRSKGRTDSG